MMSVLPSPSKSPTRTSAQVTLGFQVAHAVVSKEDPVDRPTYQTPASLYRTTMSEWPSPSKSPTLTSAQVTPGFQDAHSVVLRTLDPFDRLTHQLPACNSRPMMS